MILSALHELFLELVQHFSLVKIGVHVCRADGLETAHVTVEVAGLRRRIAVGVNSVLAAQTILEECLHEVVQVLICVCTQGTLILEVAQQLLNLVQVHAT